jgi:hypothetical protein
MNASVRDHPLPVEGSVANTNRGRAGAGLVLDRPLVYGKAGDRLYQAVNLAGVALLEEDGFVIDRCFDQPFPAGSQYVS